MQKSSRICFVLVLMLVSILFLAPFVSAQTGSLVVWENIAGGTAVCDWVENSDDEWETYNDSGIGEYNFTGNVWGYILNATTVGHRWMQTFDFTASDAETGVMCVMSANISDDNNNFYYVAYYLDGIVGGTPECYVARMVGGTPYYYNGTGFEANISNATQYTSDEIDFYSGYCRVKAIWNFYDDTEDFSLYFKIWDAIGGDEPSTWMVNDTFTMYGGEGTLDDWYPGIGADHTLSEEQTSYFRRIFFWNLSYDMIDTQAYVGVPQYDFGDFLELWDDIGDYDYWNLTTAYKSLFNRFDLTSYWNMNDITKSGGNDTVYIFTIMLTGVLDVYEEWTGEEWEYDAVFPNNILWVMVYQTTDNTAEGDDITWDDICALRFDFEQDGYDATDYTFYVDGTDTLFGYHGWTQVIPDSPVEFYGTGGYGQTDDEEDWGRIFHDDEYPGYLFALNWDLISNNTDVSEEVNISISLYDNETTDYSIWQDWNETDEDTPKTASDSVDWCTVNATDNWGLLVIEGSALDFDDPEEPYTPSIEAQTNLITGTIVPLLVATVVIVTISGMVLAGGITKETLMAAMMAAIIGVIVIGVIAGL